MSIFQNPPTFRSLTPSFPAPHQTDLTRLTATRFARAVIDLAQQYQLKEDMVALSLLGAISVAAQGRYDVILPHESITSLGLYSLICGESGEGKTKAQKKAMAAISRVQRECYERYKEDRHDYMLECDAWDVRKKKLKADLTKAEKQEKGIEEAQQAYSLHVAKKPLPPREFRLLYPDTTPAALFDGLQNILPSGALVTDEGDTYFSGAMRQARGHLNNLWSGEDLIVSRKTQEDIVVYGPRFGMHISIQPGVLERHMKPDDRDSGWAARFIVCAPEPVRGTRYFSVDGIHSNGDWEWADQRIETLVRENLVLLENPNQPRHPLSFTQEAKVHWTNAANDIEREMGQGGRFQDCPDHASKLSNQIGRVAALLHLFEEYTGDISVQTLDMAIHLCSHYSLHFQQVLMPPPQEIQDAMILRAWFERLRNQHNMVGIRYNDARQRAPAPLRNTKRLADAVSVLQFEGVISIIYDDRVRMIGFLNV